MMEDLARDAVSEEAFAEWVLRNVRLI